MRHTLVVINGATSCINCGQPESALEYDKCNGQAKAAQTAADVLGAMAVTYKERNAVYGDNYKMVGKMMAILFPQGVSAEVLHSDQFHLFELMLVKLSRFAISNLTHQDSIHDTAVYGAMIEAIIINSQEGK